MDKEVKKRRLSIEEDIDFIGQLLETMEDSLIKMEGDFEENNFEKFLQTKRSIKEIHSKITEAIR